jgi:hypothetical protein
MLLQKPKVVRQRVVHEDAEASESFRHLVHHGLHRVGVAEGGPAPALRIG